MKSLPTDLRKRLERTIVQARDIAEAGARVALESLAVHHHEPYGHMSPEQRKLRRRLRAHARHLGDRVDARTGAHTIDHLVQECAYEHWHGMLFARFLAENDLLIEPEMEVAITLDECEELAKEEGLDKWQLAARFAHHMLPQVFRPDHPVFEVQFAREHRLKLETLVEDLPAEVFTATDALGWVYQFWQTKKKDEVNRAEVKIGADELPAVTQLFTEPYMVQFLLHNSLGAWWVSRHPDKPCPVDLTYLRRTEDGTPAAGAFEGWPDDLAEFRLLDPCCGSGHFVVAAFLMLVPMRMALEGLDAAEAVDAVLRENLHGLELDQRCVAIAAFALALEAWRYPDAGGFRTLPKLNLAWCGQPVAGRKEQWLALAGGDERLEAGMAALYDTFRNAPTLGSLIDPARSVPEDMLTAGFGELEPLLEKALRAHAGEEEWEERVVSALGLASASRLLTNSYDLVVTNVPFLTGIKFSAKLRAYIGRHFDRGKANLATAMTLRLLRLASGSGFAAFVIPQSWMFLKGYQDFRRFLMTEKQLCIVARLGERGFHSPEANGEQVSLNIVSNCRPRNSSFLALDTSDVRTPEEKANVLIVRRFVPIDIGAQLARPGHIVSFGKHRDLQPLAEFTTALRGCGTGDAVRFVRSYWEVSRFSHDWEFHHTTASGLHFFDGMSEVIFWQREQGELAALAESVRHLNHAAQNWRRGKPNWGKPGVIVSQMGNFPGSIYTGAIYDPNCCAIVPEDQTNNAALWAFVESGEFTSLVKEINRNRKVEVRTFLSVGFDLVRWTKIASEQYPKGLPRPFSDNATQWIFHGHPCGSVVWDEEKKWTAHGPLRADATVLQVAVARLLGYRWPAENDPDMELADEQREWVEKAKTLYSFEDEDGIVCLPSVRGERPAADRLLELLHAAYGDEWHDGILTKLLAESGAATLDDWLRNQFFEQHCKRFHHRPFVWHIWDGRKRDGFHALVNYHRLAEGDGRGRRLLESLTYSYLGDWIARQQDGVKRGEGGAEDRLAAALELQKRLVAILEGEPPFDIFVRWKPIEEQPIGWEPDINDGVRLNIRPFMAQDISGGKKGAGILRAKPNIHWKKDRGKEPTRDQGQFPWFWKAGKFTGERVNDVHLSIEEKREARRRAEEKQ